MYVFVRKDLPFPQIVVQASHACIEAAKAFLNNDLEHPHLVVLGVNNENQLFKAVRKLTAAGIAHRIFIEPDRNNEATAVATTTISGEARNLFKNYRCLSDPVLKEAV